MKQLMESTNAINQSTLNQIGQLASDFNQFKAKGSSQFPTQLVINLCNVSVLTLRSKNQIHCPKDT